MDLASGMALVFSSAMALLIVYLPLVTALVILVGQKIFRMARNRDQRRRILIQVVCIIAGFFLFACTVAPALVWFIATKLLM